MSSSLNMILALCIVLIVSFMNLVVYSQACSGTTCSGPGCPQGGTPGTLCEPGCSGSVCEKCTIAADTVPNPPPQNQPELIALLESLVNVESGPGGSQCNPAEITTYAPCCNSNTGQASECISVDVDSIAGVYLCVGGEVGALVHGLIGDLPVSILQT